MDFGIDTLVYIIIGVIFVLAQATRKRNIAKGKPPAVAQVEKVEEKEELADFWKEFLGKDLAANQVSDTASIHQVPPVFAEPEDFHRNKPVSHEPVVPKSSLKDPGVAADAGPILPAKLTDPEHEFNSFDLRSAVVYSVILERKYV
jgi:hypothetical protein